MNILVTGSTGFIGKQLCEALQSKGHNIQVLTREDWNCTKGMPPREAIEECEAIIHLIGENVAKRRWSAEQKKKIYDSRVLSTKNLVNSIQRFNPQLKYFISASAVGFYGDRKEEILTEESEKGQGFLSDVCLDWEKASEALPKNIQRLIFRFGLVVGKNELFDKLTNLFKLGLGATLGKGEQWMSWIAVDDLVKAFIFALENKELSGVFNLVSPEPLRNKDFSATLAKHYDIFYIPFTPKKLIEIALGGFSSVLFESQKAIPKKLLEAGFQFSYPNFKAVLEKYYARR
jgi:uncharacterized protein (TIGR01777 family)